MAMPFMLLPRPAGIPSAPSLPSLEADGLRPRCPKTSETPNSEGVLCFPQSRRRCQDGHAHYTQCFLAPAELATMPITVQALISTYARQCRHASMPGANVNTNQEGWASADFMMQVASWSIVRLAALWSSTIDFTHRHKHTLTPANSCSFHFISFH